MIPEDLRGQQTFVCVCRRREPSAVRNQFRGILLFVIAELSWKLLKLSHVSPFYFRYRKRKLALFYNNYVQTSGISRRHRRFASPGTKAPQDEKKCGSTRTCRIIWLRHRGQRAGRTPACFDIIFTIFRVIATWCN